MRTAANGACSSFVLHMLRHAAPCANVVEGLEPAVRRVCHQRRLCADSDLCKVYAQLQSRHSEDTACRLFCALTGHCSRHNPSLAQHAANGTLPPFEDVAAKGSFAPPWQDRNNTFKALKRAFAAVCQRQKAALQLPRSRRIVLERRFSASGAPCALFVSKAGLSLDAAHSDLISRSSKNTQRPKLN
jgi:hypothetical protein